MQGIDLISELMVISAITAPKSKGENFVETKIIKGRALQKIAKAMINYGEKTGKKDFDRDAEGVTACESVVLIGIKDSTVLGLDCGACGFSTCKAFKDHGKITGEFKGPSCAFRFLDMGIAIGSAVKTAGMLNVDNRIMYRIGVVARDMGIVDWDFVMGIPLSVTGKNIFFDR
ncbi:4Fe-4S domain-containing protein [Candidatus Magnetomoraceae bacterium gMMP-1]